MEKLAKAIAAFEKAVDEMAFIGTIPVYSDDPEEQVLITQARKRLKTNYTRTKNRLWKLYKEKTNGN